MGACASVTKAMRAEAEAPAPEPQKEEESVANAGEENFVDANNGELERQSLGSLLQEADEMKQVEQPQQAGVTTPAQPPAAPPKVDEDVKNSEEVAASEVTN